MIAKTLAVILSAAATTFAAPAAPPVAHVTFSVLYDDPTVALSTVACSNGPNGLMLKGWLKLGDIPSFPFITGFQNASWGSPLCGTCWRVFFEGRSINVLAVDYAYSGFDLSHAAFQALTDSTGGLLPEVEGAYVQLPASYCGL